MLPLHDQVKISTVALSYYFIENHWEYFEEEEISHLLKTVDLNEVRDNTLVDCEFIRSQVNWDLVPIKKLVRCVSRLMDKGELDYVIKNIDLKSKNLRISDIIHVLRRKPEMVDVFGIEIDKISKNEAKSLLCLGKEYFLKNINIKRYNFNYMHGFEISRAYSFKLEVIKKVPYWKFNNLQISEIINKTGDMAIDLFDLSKLNTTDWLYILEAKPELYERMNPEIFLISDVFDLVKLMTMVDYEELHIMLDFRITELTPYGIETVLLHHMDRYKDKVDTTRLNDINLTRIHKLYPNFLQ